MYKEVLSLIRFATELLNHFLNKEKKRCYYFEGQQQDRSE
jgi:hypothetical protein